MKLLDVMRIAFHNLWNNRSRTVLTVIIVMIVSTLIMIVCSFGLTLTRSIERLNKAYFERLGTEYRLTGKYEDTRYQDKRPITLEEAEAFTKIAYDFEEVINQLEYDLKGNGSIEYLTNVPEDVLQSDETVLKWREGGAESNYLSTRDFMFTDLRLCEFGSKSLIRQGRVWNEKDNNSKSVWIGSEYMMEQAKYGKLLSVGDSLTFLCRTQEENASYHIENYTVAGIYDSAAVKAQQGSEAPAMIVGNGFITDFGSCFSVEEIILRYRPPQTNYNYLAIFDRMEKFVQKVNSKIEPNVAEGERQWRFTCDLVDSMKNIEIVTWVIIAVIASVSLMILLLSIGSIVNTVIISVDKNRRFLGLMKALGLNGGGVRKIVVSELLFMVVAGIIAGVLLSFGILPMIGQAIESLFTGIMPGFGFAFKVTAEMPFYLPIGTAIAFLLFALLFSRGSLKKIAMQDVISTVSEVE